jgi:hypothetical protein
VRPATIGATAIEGYPRLGVSGAGFDAGGSTAYRSRMSDGSNYLDPNRPDAVRLSVSEDDSRIVTDQPIDNALCGYRFAGLPRILAIAR